MKVAGLILAAGESRRMGSPKALLQYGGESFLDRLIALLSPRCSPVIVVLGAHAEVIQASVTLPAVFAINPDYPLGMTTSVQCGLRAVPADCDGVLFTLVDHPAATPQTLDALLAPLPMPPPLVRVPRFGEQRGHPIWFARQLINDFLALPATGAAREVVRRHVDRTQFLDLDDPGVIADIDSPEDYRRLTGARE